MRRHGVDAAIFFSDIVVPLVAIGVGIDIVPGVGPVVDKPIVDAADIDRLRPLDADDVPYISTAVAALVAELGELPLIGFAGAPFTLASYLVEGGPSRDHAKTKALMHGRPDLWHALLGRLAVIAREFLRVQIAAGAAAVQLFDSWAGSLSLADYTRVRAAAQPGRARTAGRPPFRASTSASVPASCSRRCGRPAPTSSGSTGGSRSTRPPAGSGPGPSSRAISIPALLQADWPVIEAAVRRVVAEGRAAAGHIFNLGHGVPPDTDPDVLTRIVELVRSLG